MSKNDKLTTPSQDLKENFDRVDRVGYSLWMFKSGSLDPDAVYLMLGDYEYLFGYLLERYFLNRIIENNPSLEEEFRIELKRTGDDEGYYYINNIDPKTFKDSHKHNKKEWIELNIEIHQAIATFVNQRYQTANLKSTQLNKLLKK